MKDNYLSVDFLLDCAGKTTRQVADETNLAYNTVLAYRRNSGDRLSKESLDLIAHNLGVEVWELFYHGQFAGALVKIARALGIDATPPIYGKDHKELIMDIAAKVGAEVDLSDFNPREAEPA